MWNWEYCARKIWLEHISIPSYS